MDPVEATPLPYRARGLEWLLAVGVVLIATAGAGMTALFGGDWARVLLLGLAAAAAMASWAGAVASLPRSEEALAAAAVVLTALGADPGGSLLSGGLGPPVTAGAVFAVLAYLLPSPASWPLALWAATQVTALRAVDGAPSGAPDVALAVGAALAGLATAGVARPLVARIALVVALPWWLAGVGGAVSTAWSGTGPERWLSAALAVAAAAALLAAAGRPEPDALLRPASTVGAVSGIAAGAAIGAALHSPGPVAVPLAGYLGVALASVAAALLTGAARRALLPAAVGAGATLVVLCLVQLVADARWTALSWLLAVTAAASLLTAALRRDERPRALPAAVVCGGLAAVCTVPDGGLGGPRGVAVVLTGLYLVALAGGLGLETRTRRPTVTAAAACAVGAAALLVGLRARDQLAAHLAVQGACTYVWAWLLWRRTRGRRGRWRLRRAARAGRPGAATSGAGPGDAATAEPGWAARLGAALLPWLRTVRTGLRTVRAGLRAVRRAAQSAIGVPAAAVPEQPPRPTARRARTAAPAPTGADEPVDEDGAAPEVSPAWRAGAAQLVLAAWVLAARTGGVVPEAYSLPAAVGLLMAAGPRLASGRSAPAWGPGLWVAAAPSVTWAVLAPGSTRPMLVFVVAAAVMAVGAWRSVRAPVVAGAATTVVLALGLLTVRLPLAVGSGLVVGVGLLAVGAWREVVLRQRRRQQESDDGTTAADRSDGFRRRVAAMR
ncbi:SCO7613 C-terminal domain-containing membrane protein [Geodermatophilus sp. SYSU D00742]